MGKEVEPGYPSPNDGRQLRLLKENGLSIAFLLLYVGSAVGQAWTGVHALNSERVSHGFGPLTMSQFLRTGTFLDGIATNWQAAVLQLYVLIVLASFLYQRGATHSRRIEEHRKVHGTGGWLHHNSLSVAFLLLFVLSFTGHILFSAWAENERRQLIGMHPITVASFATSTQFWTITFSNWQAEFFALFAYLVLSIFLRQRDSPESKPEDAPNSETGGGNE